MERKIVLVLFLCSLKCGGVMSEFELSDEIKEDLFNIYTGVALVERKVLHVPVEPENIKYFLFTKDNPENHTVINNSNFALLNNTKAKFVFLIHGWIEHRGKDWYEDLKNSFLKRDSSYYVIQVDWSKYSFLGYILSSYSTKDVGALIGNFVVDLHKNFSIPLTNFLVVGHSLGGQISGYIGKKVQELTGKKLPRLVALDPAGPLFTLRPENERLNKNDAEIVQVIHTDGGTFGFLKSCGTIDFFPNGGITQAGCIAIILTDPSSIAEPIYCDHQRSWKYFIEAVRKPTEYRSTKCRDWVTFATKLLCDDEEQVTMGDLESRMTGNYYLNTNSEPPFYKQVGIIKNILPKIRF